MKSFGSEGILFPVYFIMLALAVYLNVFTGSGLDIANIIINIGMFLIVGGIILYSTTHCFMPANRMMASLHLAARNFQTDFKRKGDYLWDDYKDNPKLFGNKLADTRFREYCEERRRLTLLERSAQCDIDDYLNEYYIDSVMKCGLISIVPGVMTGLGILGTFIGLSFGLQNFNTGSASAITDSIPQLMNGIKIAFHTSIYGMVFSLVFNFVYKKNLEDAYNAMDDFLDSYHKYVAPRAQNNAANIFLDYQALQMMQTEKMMEKFSDEVADKIARALRQ